MLAPQLQLDISSPLTRNAEPMPRENTPRQRLEPNARKRAWGQWLAAILDRRALANNEFGELLKNVGGHYSSATLSEWRSGKAAPSETACFYVARALRLPAGDVLRAGGFPDAAHLYETDLAGEDPRLARIDAADLPEDVREELKDEVRARLADVNSILETRLRLLLGSADVEEDDADAS